MDFIVRFFMKLTCQDAFRWSEDVSTCHPNEIVALRGFFLGLSSVVRGWPGMISNFTGNCCYWHGVHCEQAEGRVVRVELGGISLRSGLTLSSPCLVWIDSKLSFSPITLLQATCPLSCSIRNTCKCWTWASINCMVTSHWTEAFHLWKCSTFPAIPLLGSFPVLLNCPRLTTFAIEGNHFHGSLDRELCLRWPKITGLHLSSNNLSGVLHTGMANCTNLISLIWIRMHWLAIYLMNCFEFLSWNDCQYKITCYPVL